MKFIIINKLQSAIDMHKYHHGLLPNYVNEMFSPSDTNYRYNTRYGNQLKIPKHNTNITKSSWTKNMEFHVKYENILQYIGDNKPGKVLSP